MSGEFSFRVRANLDRYFGTDGYWVEKMVESEYYALATVRFPGFLVGVNYDRERFWLELASPIEPDHWLHFPEVMACLIGSELSESEIWARESWNELQHDFQLLSENSVRIAVFLDERNLPASKGALVEMRRELKRRGLIRF